MFFIKSTTNMTNNIITINSINHFFEQHIHKNVKLMLIFSMELCKPCNQLTLILDDLFRNATIDQITIPLQVIKFDYSNLSPIDQQLLESFPTTIVITPEQLLSINDDESLLQFGMENLGSVYKGQLQKLCVDHNLISF